KGLCKLETIEEVAAQGYSLNAGRYVGVEDKAEEDYDFKERLSEYHEELKSLTEDAHELEGKINHNLTELRK
ncbi:SAM-dependent DNA methyltransferase, partial [Patescibacteria group bacterium]|nr:SAM-dependent DNA methyltransferase [Patescibacteria group bacterium]